MDKGGLGVISLKMQNVAFLMKHLHKFYGRLDVPCVDLIWNTHYNSGQIPHCSSERCSFRWKDIFRLVDYNRGIAIRWQVMGKLFYSGMMSRITLFSNRVFLYSFAKKKNSFLAQFLGNMDFSEKIHEPLSMEVTEEYLNFYDTIILVQNNMQGKDKWIYS